MQNVKIIILPHQVNKLGYCTIYFELTSISNGERVRKRISSGQKVEPSKWSSKKSRVLPSDPDHSLKNSQLEKKYLKFLNTSAQNNEASTSSELVEYLEKFIQLRIALGRKRTSYKEFITVKNRMIRFEEFRLSQGLKRLKFSDLTLRLSDDLILWMSAQKYDPNTIKKHFITLKTFVNHYYNRKSEYPEIQFTQDYLKRDFGNVPTHFSPPLPLTEDEFDILCNCDHWLESRPDLIKVKDAFLFACVTGLRYSDLFSVNNSNVREGIIIISPSKTENTKSRNLCRIPLNAISSRILNKYNGSTEALFLCNQYYNRKLKELFRLLRFDEPVEIIKYRGLGERRKEILPKYSVLSSHNARDTFITMCIKRAIPIPIVMEMTGHTKYETMKKYIKLDNEAVKELGELFD